MSYEPTTRTTKARPHRACHAGDPSDGRHQESHVLFHGHARGHSRLYQSTIFHSCGTTIPGPRGFTIPPIEAAINVWLPNEIGNKVSMDFCNETCLRNFLIARHLKLLAVGDLTSASPVFSPPPDTSPDQPSSASPTTGPQ